MGIVGENGAGKSTILKILTGILIPDAGTVDISGKITGLLELGTGFNAEFSGLDNIFHNATYLGLSRREIEDRLDQIVDFTELKDFIHEPIKTYSSGMVMRLAFSVAIHADPQAFVVDEALSVGDAYFQQKCMYRIKEFKENGGSIIFVSHDMNAVKVLCDQVILLDDGRCIDYGSPKDIIDLYQGMILKKTHQGDLPVKISKKKGGGKRKKESTGIKIGTNEVELLSFKMCNADNKKISYIVTDEKLKIVYTVKALKNINDHHYGIMIRDKFGRSAFETNTYCMSQKTKPVNKGDVVQVCFEFYMNLFPGDYFITISTASGGWGRGQFKECLLMEYDLDMIKVIENSNDIVYSGFCNLKPKVFLKHF